MHRVQPRRCRRSEVLLPSGTWRSRPPSNRRVADDVTSADDVRAALEQIRARILRAGGDPDSVTLVAVTKGFDLDAATAVRAAGIVDLGENYAQELRAKADGLADPRARW